MAPERIFRRSFRQAGLPSRTATSHQRRQHTRVKSGAGWIPHHPQVARGTINLAARIGSAEKRSHMKQSVTLTITSLLSILFMTFHLADDIVFEMASPRFASLFAVLVLVIWLYGTLVLAERRSGYIIMLLGSLIGLFVPVIHMKGARGVVGGEIGKSTQAFFFVWTLLALGVTSMFSALLSAHALWRLPWRRQRVLPPEKLAQG